MATVAEELTKISATFEEMRVTMVKDRERTRKLVEALMKIAETPAYGRACVVASQAVEEWLKP